MKKYFIGIFAMGFILGFLTMGVLSMRASKSYLQTIRLIYFGQENMLAADAKKKGDLQGALIHYTNLVEAQYSPAIQFFEKQPKWSFLFPIAAISFRLAEPVDTDAKFRDGRAEGLDRMQLGILLEQLGRNDEAQEQYNRAAKLMGVSMERLQELAEPFRQNKN
ncbi:MAG TPA: hypothetical protein VGH16_13380 [Candidatus Binatia bacterium]|jgi:tetratricopeptide (TPR) repeat protein